MTTSLKLPFSFSTKEIRHDLRNFAPEDWTPHFNTQYYEGDWSGIALREPEGAHVSLYPDPTAERYVDSSALDRCPSVIPVLSTFECETEAVRFLRLGAGAAILTHRDYRLSVDDGLARVHIPIITSAAVDFYLDGQRVDMKEGEAWYLNFNLQHSVKNNGDKERVHLVIDCIVNDWFRSFFTDEDQAQ